MQLNFNIIFHFWVTVKPNLIYFRISGQAGVILTVNFEWYAKLFPSFQPSGRIITYKLYIHFSSMSKFLLHTFGQNFSNTHVPAGRHYFKNMAFS